MVYNAKGILCLSVVWQGCGEIVQHLRIYASLCKTNSRDHIHSVPMLCMGRNPGLPA